MDFAILIPIGSSQTMTKEFHQLNTNLQRLVQINQESLSKAGQQLSEQQNLQTALRKQSNDFKGLARDLTKPTQQSASFSAGFQMKNLDQTFAKTIRIMDKELEKFARSGKFNLRSLGTALLKMLFSVEKSAQKTQQGMSLGEIGNTISNTIGSGIGELLGGFFHEGGTVSESRMNTPLPSTAFDTAPRLHRGGRLSAGLGPAEFPAILQRGETVISARQSQAPQAPSTKVDVHIHENSGAKVRTKRQQQAGGNERIDVFIEAVEEQMSQRMMRGEGMAGSIENRYNLSPNPMS